MSPDLPHPLNLGGLQLYSWETAQKIQKQLKDNPPPRSVQENWDEAERVEGVYSSNAIEGSTLTLGETEAVLRGATIPGKDLVHHFAAVNVNLAWQKINTWAHPNSGPISEKLLLEIHQIVLTRINDEEAGRYRRTRVRITGAEHIPPNPLTVTDKMAQLFADFQVPNARTPIEQAADLHSGIVTIHPFADGNGRTARLMQNVALMRGGFWSIVTPVAERASYLAVTAQANAGNLIPYRQYVLEKVVDSGLRLLEMYD